MWPPQLRHGKQRTAVAHTCRDVTSVELADRYQPTDVRMVLQISERAAGHDGTIRWDHRHNFLKSEAQMDLHYCMGPMHAKTTCMAKTIDVVQRANTCKTAHTAST